jgi:hypothetical protein
MSLRFRAAPDCRVFGKNAGLLNFYPCWNESVAALSGAAPLRLRAAGPGDLRPLQGLQVCGAGLDTVEHLARTRPDMTKWLVQLGTGVATLVITGFVNAADVVPHLVSSQDFNGGAPTLLWR